MPDVDTLCIGLYLLISLEMIGYVTELDLKSVSQTITITSLAAEIEFGACRNLRDTSDLCVTSRADLPPPHSKVICGNRKSDIVYISHSYIKIMFHCLGMDEIFLAESVRSIPAK